MARRGELLSRQPLRFFADSFLAVSLPKSTGITQNQVMPNALQHILGSQEAREFWLLKRGVQEMNRGHTNLMSLCESGITLDLLDILFEQLEEHLGVVSDPDMALNNLQRFVESARSPLSMGALFQRDPTAIPILLRVFSTSQYLSDLLVVDRESYDALRASEGQPVSRQYLVDNCLLYTSPSPRDATLSRMPSSA